MIKFKLTILGSNAAIPAYGRLTSCQALEIGNQVIIIDCGEACQIRLREYKIKTSKIDLICISHLHGDHCFGLPGLLTSFSNNNRKADLQIIGPKGIKAFVEDTLQHSKSFLSYQIKFKELDHFDGSINIYGSEKFYIDAFPLDHRITTFGYKFVEYKPLLNVRKESIEKYQLTVDEIIQLKGGQDIKRTSGIIQNKDCVKTQKPARSYCYCSDTAYNIKTIDYVKDCQYLYHETTYEHDLIDLANERKHTTARDAAKIAKAAEVEYLISGHYSGRYRTVDHLIDEARKIFGNVIKGYDGVMIEFKTPSK